MWIRNEPIVFIDEFKYIQEELELLMTTAKLIGYTIVTNQLTAQSNVFIEGTKCESEVKRYQCDLKFTNNQHEFTIKFSLYSDARSCFSYFIPLNVVTKKASKRIFGGRSYFEYKEIDRINKPLNLAHNFIRQYG